MEIISVIPRGYCQGVVRAIQIAKQAVKDYPNQKITMLGMIVHNQFVVDACKEQGITFIEDPTKSRLELLDEIAEGVVIFTAHGVSDAVKEKAKQKGLITIDATCKDVEKTHTLVKQHVQVGDVIYIGKRNHPESEGTTQLSHRIHLVTNVEDVAKLPALQNILITNQTTLSLRETQTIIDACLAKFPEATVADEICNATRIRQEAVMKLENIDLLIVVGDPRSNNSKQLAETGKQSGIPEALLITSIEDIQEASIQNKNRIAITSGSSTPNALTKQVIDTLQQYAETGIFPHVTVCSEVL